jgi:hypothetical protein
LKELQQTTDNNMEKISRKYHVMTQHALIKEGSCHLPSYMAYRVFGMLHNQEIMARLIQL